MELQFDISDISHEELLVSQKDSEYYQLIIDPSVKHCLRSMLVDTINRVSSVSYSDIPEFEFAEKYDAEELVRASLVEPTFAKLVELLNLTNVQVDNKTVLNNVEDISYYIYKAKDIKGRQLIGVKRAQQMKGLAGARGRIIGLLDDSLTVLDKPLLKLDRDFDLLINESEVFAIRPNCLAYIAEADDVASKAALDRLIAIASQVSFLSLDKLSLFVSRYKRAAHLVSAISNRRDLDKIQQDRLVAACQELKIEVSVDNANRIEPQTGHEMAFLELLDNRRYVTTLTDDALAFVAASRRPVNKR